RGHGRNYRSRQGRIAGVRSAVCNLEFCPADEFAHHLSGKDLLDAVGLRLVLKSGNGDGADARGQAAGAAWSMVSATGQQRRQADQAIYKMFFHWTFPCGRTAASAVAHSTAVMAARRRLSTATHSQKPFSC